MLKKRKGKKVKPYLGGPVNIFKPKSFVFTTPTCQYNMGKNLMFSNVVNCFSVFFCLFFCLFVCKWSDIAYIRNEAQLLESVCHSGYLGYSISKNRYVCSLKVPSVRRVLCYIFSDMALHNILKVSSVNVQGIRDKLK